MTTKLEDINLNNIKKLTYENCGERGFSTIGLYQPKSEVNVAQVLRACHCFNTKLVTIQGKRYKKHSADTTAAWRKMPLLHVENLMNIIPFDCIPIAIELNPNAKPLFTYDHPRRAFYIFGPEDDNIPENILKKCKDILYIPTVNCLNLTMCVNIVLYDRMCKNFLRRKAYLEKEFQ